MAKTIAAITKEEHGSKGRFLARLEGVAEDAELTWSRANPTLIIADHTGVPDSMRGMGVGQQLVEHLIADARAGGYRIVPLCPFVRAQYQRHPEWSDVMQG